MHEQYFKYPTLKSGEIRLLSPQLHDSGRLTWELKSAPLLNNEGKAVAPRDYEALSYTWGKPDGQKFPITCNGQTLMVRKNLYDALPYLARRLKQAGSPQRQIWIDALCINQSDEPEKLDQINHMPEIYRLAREVVVWLGPGRGNDHNVAAFALIPLLARIGKEAMQYAFDTRQPRAEPNFLKTATPDASSPVWNVLGDIFFNDWYTRLWVVQEIALAQSAVALVGDSALDFSVLQDSLGFMVGVVGIRTLDLGPGIRVLQNEADKRKIDAHRIVNNWTVASCWGWLNEDSDMKRQRGLPTQASSKEISNVSSPTSSTATPIPCRTPQTSVSQDADLLLNAVFITVMSQQCERAQDHVFGVLGFAKARDEIRALRLDHRHDLADLYPVFMGYLFERGGRVRHDTTRKFLWELFSYGCLPNKTRGLPSWCPDLQVRRTPSTPIGNLSFVGKKGFTTENQHNPLGFASFDYMFAAGTGTVDIRRGGGQHVLIMRGTVFGRVSEVFPAFPEIDANPSQNWTKSANLHATIGEWEKEVAAKVLGSWGNEARDKGAVTLDTYWRTLVGNQVTFSAGESEFTAETLFALREFQARMSKIKTKLEKLEKR